ncbi:LOW QUALITY PROTEIN: cyclin-dependent kinase 2-associated protein 2 [Cygnus atratus]|uniref:LOW QUALITY PROTEIN: cyclin-dependent kinase 2-associated protein 2 n=1 Tax=Cygnus atratus TaxID=8868 RepID=UPI0021B8342A|nr:LOW QUALITY PROTEIN: cyclin-dependent kinase 2-associated protein 2 [Cygnus atratus]
MSYKPIAPRPRSASPAPGPAAPPAATSVPSPSGSAPGAAAAPFRPLFNDFGPPSMGYVQAMKPPRCPGLAEHLHRPAVRHRGDGQGDPAHPTPAARAPWSGSSGASSTRGRWCGSAWPRTERNARNVTAASGVPLPSPPPHRSPEPRPVPPPPHPNPFVRGRPRGSP